MLLAITLPLTLHADDRDMFPILNQEFMQQCVQVKEFEPFR